MNFDLPDVVSQMAQNANAASGYLKALGNETRLMILCHLTPGKKSVGELETLLDSRQATVSQHLARLRPDGLVDVRRQGKSAYYSIADNDALAILKVLHQKFC